MQTKAENKLASKRCTILSTLRTSVWNAGHSRKTIMGIIFTNNKPRNNSRHYKKIWYFSQFYFGQRYVRFKCIQNAALFKWSWFQVHGLCCVLFIISVQYIYNRNFNFLLKWIRGCFSYSLVLAWSIVKLSSLEFVNTERSLVVLWKALKVNCGYIRLIQLTGDFIYPQLSLTASSESGGITSDLSHLSLFYAKRTTFCSESSAKWKKLVLHVIRSRLLVRTVLKRWFWSK